MWVFDSTYHKITITNYIFKTSLYTTFCMYPSGPWPLKILMFALACDPWDSNIQLTMVKDWRPGLGMPFLDSNTCARGGGYLFLPGFSSLYDAIHGWMTGRMDGRVTWCHPWMDDGTYGWMEKAPRPRRPLLYVIRKSIPAGLMVPQLNKENICLSHANLLPSICINNLLYDMLGKAMLGKARSNMSP